MTTTKIININIIISFCFIAMCVDAKEIQFLNSPNKINNKYIVVFNDELIHNEKSLSPTKSYSEINSEFTVDIAFNSKSRVISSFNSNNIFVSVLYNTNAKKIHMLLSDNRIKNIYAVTSFEFDEVQYNPRWGLDRIDQTYLPLDYIYESSNDGANVDVFVIDSGIDNSHPEFSNRNIHEYDAFINIHDEPPECIEFVCDPYESPSFTDYPSTDTNGHGTKVAGVIGGIENGVAKNVNLYSIKISRGSNPPNSASFWNALVWLENHIESSNPYPTVVNMSFSFYYFTADYANGIESILSRLHFVHNVTLIASAGNNDSTTCKLPAIYPHVISVGGSNEYDNRAINSSFGECVDIFAPGEDITLAHIDGGFIMGSGTSFAAPHVVGAAAMYLHNNPDATPDIVKDALINSASNIDIADEGSPDLLLNVSNLTLVADIYEDDDTYSQIKDLGNGIRNFYDDNVDFIHIDQEFPSWAGSCYFELESNYGSNIDICIDVYNEFDHVLTGSSCISPASGITFQGACPGPGHINCGLDWKVTNSIIGVDTNYKFNMVCEGNPQDPDPES